MIRYTSTRGDSHEYTFSEAICQGLAADGGLLIPQRLPSFSHEDFEALLPLSYPARAKFILSRFETDFSDETISSIVAKAYGSNFDHPSIAPVVHVKDNQYVLELWHGPTLAFKDMALQIMPYFFTEAIEKQEHPSEYLILVATSGDTGKAALEGYKDKEHIKIAVLYPDHHVSPLQELQMVTQEGNNVAVYAVKGDFDTAQRTVKDIFNDAAFAKTLFQTYNTRLSSANSMNWGRLVPQIIYHISSYLDLVNQGAIRLGDPVDVAVPSGNFGNLLAAYYAKEMGLPIRTFICASNENNVLTDFLRTGVYDIQHRTLVTTPSPSMDILIANNIERLLYSLTNDTEKVNSYMESLQKTKRFEVDDELKKRLQELFFADWISNDESLSHIRDIFDETQYLMDPHTSVAYAVATRYGKKHDTKIPVVVCSTAYWGKFAPDVYKAFFGKAADKDADVFRLIDAIAKKTELQSLPTSLTDLQNKKKRHTQTCDADKQTVEDILIHDMLRKK